MIRTISHSTDLAKSFNLCLLAYVMALATAFVIGYINRELHPALSVLYADVAATLVIFFFGRLFRNASLYDPYWSVAPPVIAVYWLIISPADGALLIRQIIITVLVFVWAVRLTYNWARQWRGLEHEDWRYRNLRKKTGNRFWLVELTGIELMPTLIVFLACLPLYPALATGNKPIGFLDIIAIIVTAGAIILETTADRQLRQFVLKNTKPGAIMDRGLWAYSRHPNYFGEILFWWGLWVFGLAVAPGYWWTVIGPVVITLLFITISIPLMDKRNLKRRPGYGEHCHKIPALIPRISRSR